MISFASVILCNQHGSWEGDKDCDRLPLSAFSPLRIKDKYLPLNQVDLPEQVFLHLLSLSRDDQSIRRTLYHTVRRATADIHMFIQILNNLEGCVLSRLVNQGRAVLCQESAS